MQRYVDEVCLVDRERLEIVWGWGWLRESEKDSFIGWFRSFFEEVPSYMVDGLLMNF